MVIVGMFANRTDAEAAIRDLKTSGFTEERIGIAMQDHREGADLAERTGSEVAEGAATGAVSGGILGGVIGLLGSLLIPGVGPIVVGGLLASALTGAGIGAAAGGLIGALVGMGVPETDARHFETGLGSGRVLVTVNAFTRSDEVVDIFRRRGADFGPSGSERYAPAESQWGMAYEGSERRYHFDPNYTGPERRLATL
jgi:hypothetical protein